MKDQNNNISNRIINTLQLPKDVLTGAAIISMLGNTELVIENFNKIIKFESKTIILQCNKNQLYIGGNNLTIEYYTDEEIKITGYIAELKFQ